MSEAFYAFLLENTDDPELLRQAAYHLGDQVVNHHPRIPFPADFVRDAQRRDVNFAAHAARYCGDPELHEELWHARRKAVRFAVASSPFLAEDLRRRFSLEARTSAEYDLRSAIKSLHRQPNTAQLVAELIAPGKYFFASTPDQIEKSELFTHLLHHPYFDSDQINTVVSYVLSHGGPHLASEIIDARYHWRDSPLRRCTLSYAELLSALPKAEAAHLVADLVDDERCFRDLDVESAELFVTLLPKISCTPRAFNAGVLPPEILRPDVIDIWLRSKNWAVVAASCALSDEQFTQLLNVLDFKSPDAEAVLTGQITSSARLHQALLALPPTFKVLIPTPWLQNLPEVDPSDFELLCAHLASDDAAAVIVQGVEGYAGRVWRLPSATVLEMLSSAKVTAYDFCSALYFEEQNLDESDLRAWLRVIPGIFEVLDSAGLQRTPQLVYEEILASGHDVAEVLSLLNHPAASLDKVCRSLDALNRSRASHSTPSPR